MGNKQQKQQQNQQHLAQQQNQQNSKQEDIIYKNCWEKFQDILKKENLKVSSKTHSIHQDSVYGKIQIIIDKNSFEYQKIMVEFYQEFSRDPQQGYNFMDHQIEMIKFKLSRDQVLMYVYYILLFQLFFALPQNRAKIYNQLGDGVNQWIENQLYKSSKYIDVMIRCKRLQFQMDDEIDFEDYQNEKQSLNKQIQGDLEQCRNL